MDDQVKLLLRPARVRATGTERGRTRLRRGAGLHRRRDRHRPGGGPVVDLHGRMSGTPAAAPPGGAGRGRRGRGLLRPRGPAGRAGPPAPGADPGPRGRRHAAARHRDGERREFGWFHSRPPRSRARQVDAPAPGGARHDRAGAAVPRGPAALDHRSAHRPLQPAPLRRHGPARGPARPPPPPAALGGDAGRRPLQGGERHLRPRRRGSRAGGAGGLCAAMSRTDRPEGPAGRRRVLPAPARDRRSPRPTSSPSGSGRSMQGPPLRGGGPVLPGHRQHGGGRLRRRGEPGGAARPGRPRALPGQGVGEEPGRPGARRSSARPPLALQPPRPAAAPPGRPSPSFAPGWART